MFPLLIKPYPCQPERRQGSHATEDEVEGPREYFPEHAASGSSHENLSPANSSHRSPATIVPDKLRSFLTGFAATATSKKPRAKACSQRLVASRSINNLDRPAAAQFFHSGDKAAVCTYIISAGFHFHHHHKIARAIYGKQHLGFAFALVADRMQGVYRSFRRAIQRDANAYGARQFWLRFFQRRELVDDHLGIGALFHADAGLYQHGNFLLQDGLQLLVGVRKDNGFDRAGHVFQQI